MAAADNTTGVQKDWQKRESFLSALVQVAIVGILLAAAVFFFVQRAHTRKAVAEKLKEARTIALRDNPADLRKALVTLDEVFQLDDGAPDALALAADIHAELWMAHREAAHEAKARDYLAKAIAAESNSEERYGTEALLKLAAGDAAGADAFHNRVHRLPRVQRLQQHVHARLQRQQQRLRAAVAADDRAHVHRVAEHDASEPHLVPQHAAHEQRR